MSFLDKIFFRQPDNNQYRIRKANPNCDSKQIKELMNDKCKKSKEFIIRKKKGFDPQLQSRSFWKEKKNKNLALTGSSVQYNIVNHSIAKQNHLKLQDISNNFFHRKKGLSKYVDILKEGCSNNNAIYHVKQKENL